MFEIRREAEQPIIKDQRKRDLRQQGYLKDIRVLLKI